jgi:diguanylate cyclase (GGDEF)-like protein
MNQAGALLAVALDQKAMLQSLREQEERLRQAALYDHLTGLANRELFLDRLGQAVRRAKRQQDYHFGVLFLDLDGFKAINDTLGHAAGDQLLVGVAGRIRAGLRESDTAARFGGDEFLILLDGMVDEDMPSAVVRRVNTALARPFLIEGRQVTISASVGVATSSARYETAETLLRDADMAMYQAKTANRVARLDRHRAADVA